MVTEKLLQIGVKSFFYAQKTLLLKGLDLCKRLVYLLFMGTAGLFMPIIATAQTVLIQEITRPAMLGRVFSIVQMISAGAMPMAILFFGPLADIVAVETILIVSGAFLVLVGIWYDRSNKLDQSERSSP